MLTPSKHNILTQVNGHPEWLLVNLLSGQADLLDAPTAARFQKGEYDDVSALTEKGYLVEPEVETRRYEEARARFEADQREDEIQIFFVASYVCNFGCSYCFQDEYAPKETHDLDQVIDAFFAYVDDTFAGRRKYITLFGGEPLLDTPKQRRVVERLVEGTRSRGLDLAVITNGYQLAAFVPLLETGRIREVQVTLDGPPEIHDKRRLLKGGGRTFDKVVAGIDAALAAGLTVNLRAVLDKENLPGFGKLAHFAIDKGWTDLPNFKTQVGRNYELHHCQTENTRLYTRLSLWQDMYELIQADPEILQFYRPAYSISRFLFDEGRLPDPLFDACPATKTEWAFDATGAIYPCTANVGKAGEEIGTYFPTRSLVRETVAEWSKRSVATMSGCAGCANQLACGGGCGAVSKSWKGTISAPDCRPVKELLGLGVALYGQRELGPT
ncbi:MAG: radical SAM protein [Polyangiaceae bacterium]